MALMRDFSPRQGRCRQAGRALRPGVTGAGALALWATPGLAGAQMGAAAATVPAPLITVLIGLVLLALLLAVACVMLVSRQRQLVQALADARTQPMTAPAVASAAPAESTVVQPEPEAEVAAPAELAAHHEHESFSYTVSHDLRAPIRVVEGFTKILKEDYGRALDRIGNDHLDRVLGAAARMNSMIDALLALSQLSSQPLARQPVNLSQLAAYVAEDLRRHWPDREVLLQIEPDMEVTGDPTLLRVVVENLLGNAWKYTSKCARPEIRFARHPRDRLTFTVADNGAGFDMRFADRLFGVFQRLHSATDYQGTGVGLASVRRILRRHGGDIWAEAEVNQGARFHFSVGR